MLNVQKTKTMLLKRLRASTFTGNSRAKQNHFYFLKDRGVNTHRTTSLPGAGADDLSGLSKEGQKANPAKLEKLRIQMWYARSKQQ